MKISAKCIAEALLEVCEENPEDISQIAKEFYFYLLKKRKSKMLPFILEKLKEIENEKLKIKEIEIETASPLEAEPKNKIKKLFDKQNVIIKEKINSNILGGISLRTDEVIIDGSLENHLERLKEEMWQTPIK